MSLKAISGNRELIDSLCRELSHRPSHAYLFAGPRGIGKAKVAQGFAHGFLCERSPGPDFCCTPENCPIRNAPALSRGRGAMVSATPSCDCCAACVQVAGGVHPDYDYVAREANRTDVLIEQVRGLIARLGVRPSRGPRRIAIVDDAETLNLPAQNALLKTLEEPPGDTLIFLISNNERALLDTIRSRTRPVRFAPLNTADVADVLVERAGLKRDQADATARLARGSAGRALQLAEGEGPPTEELLSALKGAGEMDFAKIQTLGQELFGARDQAADNFELIARFLEEMLCCKLLDDAPLSSDRKTADLMNLISQRLKPEQIATLADHALRARAAIDAMANSRLQAEQWWTAASAAMRGE